MLPRKANNHQLGATATAGGTRILPVLLSIENSLALRTHRSSDLARDLRVGCVRTASNRINFAKSTGETPVAPSNRTGEASGNQRTHRGLCRREFDGGCSGSRWDGGLDGFDQNAAHFEETVHRREPDLSLPRQARFFARELQLAAIVRAALPGATHDRAGERVLGGQNQSAAARLEHAADLLQTG